MEDDDLGVELEDEYNPLKPNSYEEYLRRKEAEEAAAKAEEKRIKMSSSEKKSLTALSNYSDSDSEDEEERRKEEKRKGEPACLMEMGATLVMITVCVEVQVSSLLDHLTCNGGAGV